jgi:hypothetical protein
MRKNGQWLALLTAAVVLTLSGCGGEKQQPPTAYTVGEDSLPALNEAVPLEEDSQYDQIENEDGTVSYQYQNLSSPTEVVQAYGAYLEENDQCVLLDEKGDYLSSDESLADSGKVVAAKPSQQEDGLFELSIDWDESSCTVTPSFAKDAQLPEKKEAEGMSLEEAVAYLQSIPPEVLGLEGSSMSDYDVFPEDGLVFVDDKASLCLNVYSKSTHQYEGSYLLVGPEHQLCQLDRDTGQVYPLLPTGG